jgi:hypothetical protein
MQHVYNVYAALDKLYRKPLVQFEMVLGMDWSVTRQMLMLLL